MDLRSKNLSQSQLTELHRFIIQRKLAYQPFIFTDTLEVGEGLKFHDGESEGGNVYWQDSDPRVQDLLETDLYHFRECNQNLRVIYDHFVHSIIKHVGGDISQLTFAEIGCNTGYFLHSLALQGAKQCIGFDFTNNEQIFQWFNDVLGIKNEFHFAEWDSLKHTLNYSELPEVDVTLSVNVTCHLADPIHHLCYLCDHSRKAVFVYCPVNQDSNFSVHFGNPGKYPNSLDYPLSFDNEIRPSIPLIELTLREAGFEQIIEIDCPENISENWKNWFYSQKGFLALRTRNTRTALFHGSVKRTRPIPGDVQIPIEPLLDTIDPNDSSTAIESPKLIEDFGDYNIVLWRKNYYGLPKAIGSVNLVSDNLSQLDGLLIETSIERLRYLITKLALEKAECKIQAMESSKFWKIRIFWMRLKRLLSSPGTGS